MIKKVRQYLIYIFILFVWFFAINGNAFASDSSISKDIQDIRIVPTVENANQVDAYITLLKWDSKSSKENSWSFRNKYEYATNELQSTNDLWWQLAWWFINFNTILQYLAYLIRVIANIAIAVAALFIIRWWYEYVMQAFNYKAKTAPSVYITNIVIWIFIMSFAYGIIKILAFTFLQ